MLVNSLLLFCDFADLLLLHLQLQFFQNIITTELALFVVSYHLLFEILDITFTCYVRCLNASIRKGLSMTRITDYLINELMLDMTFLNF